MEKFVEIVVVTRAPMNSGNMAMGASVFVETDEPEPDNEYAKKVEWLGPELIGIDMFLRLRQPVFQVGEILFLDAIGREVNGAGRKPDKWDVDVQDVATIEEALELSQKIQEEEAAKSKALMAERLEARKAE